jgi:putative Mn2+ efflux pump MntP
VRESPPVRPFGQQCRRLAELRAALRRWCPANGQARQGFPARWGQCGEARFDDGAHTRRYRRTGAEPGQLLDEQRVAASAAYHIGDKLRSRFPAEDPGHQLGTVHCGQWGERDRGTGEGDRLPAGTDDEYPRRGETPRGEVEQRDRRLVGPVQVVEDEDEQPVAPVPAQCRGHLVEVPEPRLRHGLRPLFRPDRLRYVEPELTQDLYPRPVRGRPVPGPAGAPRDERAELARVPGDVARDGGLADPRFAGQQYERALPGIGPRERVAEVPQDLRPPDQYRHAMTLLRLLAFLAPLSLESFAVAAALGAAGPTRRQRWRLTALFVAFEGGMPIIGLLLGTPVARAVGGAADYVAAAALVAVGLWLLFEDDETEEGQRLQRLTSAGGLALLGLGLSISLDELAIGFTIGLARLPVAAVLVGIAVQAFVAVQLGLRLGARVSESWREYAQRGAGVMLVALGVVLALTHLL